MTDDQKHISRRFRRRSTAKEAGEQPKPSEKISHPKTKNQNEGERGGRDEVDNSNNLKKVQIPNRINDPKKATIPSHSNSLQHNAESTSLDKMKVWKSQDMGRKTDRTAAKGSVLTVLHAVSPGFRSASISCSFFPIPKTAENCHRWVG